jgi:hypothetical protein
MLIAQCKQDDIVPVILIYESRWRLDIQCRVVLLDRRLFDANNTIYK